MDFCMRIFDIITTNMKEQPSLVGLEPFCGLGDMFFGWEIRKRIEEITTLEGSKRAEAGLGTI